MKPDKALNTRFTEAYDEEQLEKGKKGKKADDVKKARDYMCRNYFDVRAFGAVMSTGDGAPKQCSERPTDGEELKNS